MNSENVILPLTSLTFFFYLSAEFAGIHPLFLLYLNIPLYSLAVLLAKVIIPSIFSYSLSSVNVLCHLCAILFCHNNNNNSS
jgi:hypothetical protein